MNKMFFKFTNLKQIILQNQCSTKIKDQKWIPVKHCWDFQSRTYAGPAGTPGSGAGRGGGAGGSVRESGGGLGKYGAAQEEGYFYNKQKEQLKNIKKELKEKPEATTKNE